MYFPHIPGRDLGQGSKSVSCHLIPNRRRKPRMLSFCRIAVRLLLVSLSCSSAAVLLAQDILPSGETPGHLPRIHQTRQGWASPPGSGRSLSASTGGG